MTLSRVFSRANRRIFSAFAALCAIACFGGVAAQAQQSKTVFRDARSLNLFDDVVDDAKQEQKNADRVVAVPYEKSKRESENSKIRSVSAEVAKPRANAKTSKVAQTQYAKAKTEPATAQNLSMFNPDEPFKDVCPDPRDFPSILDAPYKLVIPSGSLPQSCPLPDEDYVRKAPTPITLTWKASNLCYKPLYFEDVQLERYGHYRSPYLQPFLSRFRFWLTIPCLPYLMGVNPPQECIYDLGYYRPGNCAPSMIEPVPISLRGGLLEAGAIVGVAAIIP